MKKLIEDLRKPGVLLGLVSQVCLLLVLLNVKVDIVKVNEIAEVAVSILSMFGVMISARNNPETPGIDLFTKKK